MTLNDNNTKGSIQLIQGPNTESRILIIKNYQLKNNIKQMLENIRYIDSTKNDI